MAAGDLENILPTPTAKRTNNITWVDANGIVYPVKEVHWSDANGVGHLIWQRDHSPTGDEYTDISQNKTYLVLFKYVATSNTTITSIKQYGFYNSSWGQNAIALYKSDGTFVSSTQSNSTSFSTEVLNIDGVDTTIDVVEHAVNINVEPGEYFIVDTLRYNGSYIIPVAYKNITGEYLLLSLSNDWNIGSNLQSFTSHSDYLIKAEVNGVQV